jgi:hypothetical protein
VLPTLALLWCPEGESAGSGGEPSGGGEEKEALKERTEAGGEKGFCGGWAGPLGGVPGIEAEEEEEAKKGLGPPSRVTGGVRKESERGVTGGEWPREWVPAVGEGGSELSLPLPFPLLDAKGGLGGRNESGAGRDMVDKDSLGSTKERTSRRSETDRRRPSTKHDQRRAII